jgi:hypothetical protein
VAGLALGGAGGGACGLRANYARTHAHTYKERGEGVSPSCWHCKMHVIVGGPTEIVRHMYDVSLAPPPDPPWRGRATWARS